MEGPGYEISGPRGLVLGNIVCLAVVDVLVLLVAFLAGLPADAAFLVAVGFFFGCLASVFFGGMLKS